jgi:nickel transport protein
MKKKFLVLLIIPFLLLGLATTAAAHGVEITYQTKAAVEIISRYDMGEPVGGARVTVYAPDDPATPWLTGVSDEEGRFTFTPDSARPGTWDVQVRHAGHGGTVHVPVGEDATGSGGAAAASAHTPLQIVLMAACVVWGLVGTALFFARRKD